MTSIPGRARNGADAVCEVLQRWGVRKVFTCPGSTEPAFLEVADAIPSIEVIITSHEAISVTMADGHARQTGEPTVAYLHANVGLANGLAGLMAASTAYSPVVIINGMKSQLTLSRAGFTTAWDSRSLVRGYTKYEWQVLERASIAEDLNRAFHAATSPPTGPAWVGIPQDVLEAETPRSLADAWGVSAGGPSVPSSSSMDAATSLLAESSRPVIVAGAEVARRGAGEALVDLAERLGAHVFHEDRRSLETFAFPTGHRLYRGLYSSVSPSTRESDLLFLAGVRSAVEFEAVREVDRPTAGSIVQCHSDPLQIGWGGSVDLGLVGDIRWVADELVRRISSVREAGAEAWQTDGHTAPAPPPPDGPGPQERAPGDPLRVGQVTAALRGFLGDDVTVVGDATTGAGALIKAVEGSSARYVTSASGSLGWGMGAAMGIQMADPSRRVVAVLGDGVFQFGMPGLWTAVRYDIPVIFVVLNNQAYAAVGSALRKFGVPIDGSLRDLPGVDLSGPAITTIAAGFGIRAERVVDEQGLLQALETAFDGDSPCLIEVMTDPEDFPGLPGPA
jgi:benzoylformate decarboxylase